MVNIGSCKYGYIYFMPVVKEAGIGDFNTSIAKLLNGNSCSEKEGVWTA